MLPKRLLRAVALSALFSSLLFLAALQANRNRYIHIDDYLPPALVPQYFQPPSDGYIVDVAVGSCMRLAGGGAQCGVPAAGSGLYGDVGAGGGWRRVDKDLHLGRHWTRRAYLSVKRVTAQYYEARRGPVVLDVAVAAAADCAIRGNRRCIPKAVLEELSMANVFDAEDLSELMEMNKGVPADLGTRPGAEPSAAAEESKKVAEESKKAAEESKKAAGAARKRTVETSHHALSNFMRIPSPQELEAAGWRARADGLWLKFGAATDAAVSAIDVLFGDDAVDPRPNRALLPPWTRGGFATVPRLSVRKGPAVDFRRLSAGALRENAAGRFKILQVADLHFSSGPGKCRDPAPAETVPGCEADPRTVRFVDAVLAAEQPDLVVLSGDQILGDGVEDPETALFKAVHPFASRRIPYAVIMGNHDDEAAFTREQMMRLAASLPYSVAALGPDDVDGFGNYRVGVASASGPVAALYFLDSHARSKAPKTHPGYDWFKESQVRWVGQEADAARREASRPLLSMAFFHIPLPQYRNLDQPMVGQQREGITAPRYETGMRKALGGAGVQVASCGHDHANDYCVMDQGDAGATWLCYGGGSGEGGYGGYGGYIRRVRVFEMDSAAGTIRSWKRAENEPEKVFDEQTLVRSGEVQSS